MFINPWPLRTIWPVFFTIMGMLKCVWSVPNPAGPVFMPAAKRIQLERAARPAGGDAGQSVFPGADAAQGIGGLDIAGSDCCRSAHGLLRRQIPQQCTQEAGDGGIA